ncbi:MAG: YqiA/YcfP family alpha/beta fold hydrolase [Aquificota bacterium]|nr:YqiA/YcfP family alpha/beta fold hydrolase [Aquificota bacterium]
MFFFDLNNPERIWIHLHGFATNVMGGKIEFARNHFRRTKIYSFFAMDMDYEKHTTTEVLDVLEALILGFSERFREITLCGSSHGGYVAVNYIRFRKTGNVKKVLLLAPSFETLRLIVKELGEEKVKYWLEGKEKLRLVEEGREVEVREDFARDILENGYEIIRNGEVNFPERPPVDIIVVHGTRDEIVPVESTRTFVSRVRVRRYIEVDDDHRLSETFGRVLLQLIEEGLI